MRIALVFALAVTMAAQEGHPLAGTWDGDWGPSPDQRTHLTLVLNWDGQRITGTINPGRDGIEIPNVSLDVSTWTFRFEAGATPRGGQAVRIAAEGRLEEPGSPRRRIVGTWTQGTTKGDFKAARN